MYGEAMSKNTQIQINSVHTYPIFRPDSKSCLEIEIGAMVQKLFKKKRILGFHSTTCQKLTLKGSLHKT